MAAAIGWYGPLIDLSRASSHVDDFVQLLVFVHQSQPAQEPITSNRRPMLMMKIQIGDDTRPYFVLSVRHKYIGTMIVPGDIILLQNVKIVKFKEVLEAATIQISLVTVLAHGVNIVASKDNDHLIAHLQLGSNAREKLRRVIYWIQHTESTLDDVRRADTRQKQNRVQVPKNWKSSSDQNSTNYLSIKDALFLRSSCTIVFHAFIGEIIFSYSGTDDEAQEQFALRNALLQMDNNRITENIICMGCKTCGFPIGSRLPLYCSKKSNYVHDIGHIYRPFLLHVWDHTGLMPLLVKNRTATILFGKLAAEKVYACYRLTSTNKSSTPLHYPQLCSSGSTDFAGEDDRKSGSNVNAGNVDRNRPNLHLIWLILVKVLLQKQESPFLFEVNVDKEKDIENGRFELNTLKMPCYIRERG